MLIKNFILLNFNSLIYLVSNKTLRIKENYHENFVFKNNKFNN